MKTIHYLLIFFVIWNLIVFLIYGADKRRAVKDKWRIPEKTLMLLALFFGATGAFAGMSVFRHKTQHKKFSIGVPLLMLLNYACIAAAVYYFCIK
ncbi:MAG: DUF1294 domain-containing protein [Clostridia bacterium]|nr:DUF1294 domain-containing protein [Clostridia bacterium]